MGCDEIFPQNDQFWPNPPKASQVQCEFMKEYQENLKAYMQASMAFINKMATPPPCPQAALDNDHSVLIDGKNLSKDISRDAKNTFFKIENPWTYLYQTLKN